MIIHEESSESEVVLETPLGTKSPTATSTPQTIPLEIMLTKSVTEEVPIFDIRENVSDTGADVNMSFEGTKSDSQGIIIISTFEPISHTSISHPPYISKVQTTTTSPTFETIIQQPFTTLFQSQSTDPPKSNSDDETDGGGFGGTFADLEFDYEEDNMPDHILMYGK